MQTIQRPGASLPTEVDVLVVGSGAAGLTAAITVAEAGLNVAIIEKADVFGGTTAYSAGVVWVPCSQQAREAGIQDSEDRVVQYIRHEAGPAFDEAKARTFAQQAPKALTYLESHTHAHFVLAPAWPDYHPLAPGASEGGRSLAPLAFEGTRLGPWFSRLRWPLPTTLLWGGLSIARGDVPHFMAMTRSAASAWHVAKLVARYGWDRLRHPRGTRLTNGNALVAALATSALERGVGLHLRTPLLRLQLAGGDVTGAWVGTPAGEHLIRARKGVVLACGGFPHGAALQAQTHAHVAAGQPHRSMAPTDNTGDGIAAAMALGGQLVRGQQPAAWTPASTVVDSAGQRHLYPHFLDRNKPGFIAVDRHGQRFVNESDSYHDFITALLRACRGDEEAFAWIIADHPAVRRYGIGVAPPAPGRLAPYVRSGYVVQAQSIAELASKTGVPEGALSDTVDGFNGPAREGRDPVFGRGENVYHHFGGDASRGPNCCVAPIETGPFYALKVTASDLGTFAGLSTDVHARVLNEAGQPIRGLYACGNDMASVFGGEYSGAGITIGPALTFGHLAGLHLAALG